MNTNKNRTHAQTKTDRDTGHPRRDPQWDADHAAHLARVHSVPHGRQGVHAGRLLIPVMFLGAGLGSHQRRQEHQGVGQPHPELQQVVGGCLQKLLLLGGRRPCTREHSGRGPHWSLCATTSQRQQDAGRSRQVEQVCTAQPLCTAQYVYAQCTVQSQGVVGGGERDTERRKEMARQGNTGR